MGWKEIKSYRMHVRVLQKIVGGELYQVDLPLKRDFRDYEYAMYRVVCEVARFNNKGFLATCFMFLKPWTVQL
jgi:hypothetical protein